MKTPQLWRHLKRHPLSAEYKDITGPAFFRFCSKLKAIGFLTRFPIILLDGQVLDGWQRLRACIETDIEPECDKLHPDADPAEYVEAVNDERRHETPEEREERIQARNKRISESRSEGKSIRAIAGEEGIPKSTVQDVVNSGVRNSENRTPDHGNSKAQEAEEPKKTVGVDGKTYAAEKPRPAPPPPDDGPPANDEPKPRSGKPAKRFDEKKFEKAYGDLTRCIDARANAMGKGAHHKRCMDILGEFLFSYKKWKQETA